MTSLPPFPCISFYFSCCQAFPQAFQAIFTSTYHLAMCTMIACFPFSCILYICCLFWSHSVSSHPQQTVELKAVCEESVFWCSGVREHVNWWFDCSAVAAPTEDRREEELCTVSPSSGSLGPGQSIWLVVRISPVAIRTGEK